jgi:hypothetical protein
MGGKPPAVLPAVAELFTIARSQRRSACVQTTQQLYFMRRFVVLGLFHFRALVGDVHFDVSHWHTQQLLQMERQLRFSTFLHFFPLFSTLWVVFIFLSFFTGIHNYKSQACYFNYRLAELRLG